MISQALASTREEASIINCQSLGLIDYEEALAIQRQLHQEVVDQISASSLLLLQHPPVFTAGRRTLDSERPIDGSKVIDVDRGGKITFHGPGQIVGYPIVKLKKPNDVVGFVRQLEKALIQICQDFNIAGQTYCERSGVWVRDERGDRKIAAIGIRVAKGVTMHGFALNVNPDLSFFDRIIPCGIADAQVTSMEKELNRSISLEQVQEVVEARMKQSLSQVSQ
ncbi:MAG TPA: lipoyl(octanoyl) transferase LipB [Candidatus Nanopelagicaceae bacterium]|nr:lipoyl(octanoyl) transferase LipB [Candidatus Nanopelagicaceae bacterium]